MPTPFVIIQLPLPNTSAFTGDQTIGEVATSRQFIDDVLWVALTRSGNHYHLVAPYMCPHCRIQDVAPRRAHGGTPIRENRIINREMTKHEVANHHFLHHSAITYSLRSSYGVGLD